MYWAIYISFSPLLGHPRTEFGYSMVVIANHIGLRPSPIGNERGAFDNHSLYSNSPVPCNSSAVGESIDYLLWKNEDVTREGFGVDEELLERVCCDYVMIKGCDCSQLSRQIVLKLVRVS